jgi:hypothetical protein
VNALSLFAFASTWAIGHALLRRRTLGRWSRKITLLKDGLVAGAVIAGVGSMLAGTKLSHTHADVDAENAENAEKARLERIANVLGIANVVLEAAAVATTTVLAMRSRR